MCAPKTTFQKIKFSAYFSLLPNLADRPSLVTTCRTQHILNRIEFYVFGFTFYHVLMWLISVTPISRGIIKERLYYFSSQKFGEGDVIEIPVRNRQVVAKVEEVRLVADAKSELKNLPFTIRKVQTLKTSNFLSQSFMSASKECAAYFAATLGAVLHTLLPPKRLISSLDFSSDDRVPFLNEPRSAQFVLQLPDHERISSYRRLTREEFAKKKSLIILVPTIAEAKKLHNDVNKGIENYAYLLHQRLPKSAVSKTWKDALHCEHPILLIATPQFMAIPRNDVGVIAIERESSRNYKRDSRPFLDYRTFAMFYARKIGASLIYADSMIRTETYHKLESGEIYEQGKTSFRPLYSAQTEIMTVDKKSGKNTPGLSPETLRFIKSTREANYRLFILCPRRGIAPRTICRNCGTSLLCPNCSGSLVLHGTNKKSINEGTVYLCHRCGFESHSMLRCEKCNSWDLIAFRIGTEEIEIELKTAIGEAPIIRFDKDSLKTDAESSKAVLKFLNTAGSILIGTEMVFSYLAEQVEASLVLFPELLTAVPDFESDESALRFILRAKSQSINKFAVQTAEPDLPIIKLIHNSNLAEFYRKEIDLRKNLGYPPFSILVLITFKKNEILKKRIQEIFANYKPMFFEGFGSSAKSDDRVLFRLARDNWPDSKFRELCLSLPQNCQVEVMPAKLFS
ncbi:MAG: hypothetical protein A3H57_00130 [Candidatus Taylorbacteria bacterium RIFCSPLOWO2_02_FULL_43_11]|uniref:Primosomal protein N' 3' DNA-binding domain-containing protein n=1 Tax=Candidatus Taylorbacteria bacterium RIFCSPHIGHO2_02_FULL_43_32b TaxID=1802306 RepID=A0A1G2MKM3_9BACT|nr:MAG: hypothetical protein A2743_02620 [Candidatus Taylorbacteria bacterium RIFCSPHIGHO2_01_FULL_43_47]OHA23532.1 MAG: hypothetical protein A3C72_04775 [Candidatus Taylorbacteria bacterium RIFCSPHIGHO2_02_FULL_43_32b]OHA30534.1 MAG: hypothetical protein A3B08_04305 [Candidatus Taylorbacteria bacterium RIFCSPLOWO2_01_FULL_43_44]OHA37095.1 MAG: hypothetical protein A3H57_00130 [Candidatus Taylorbacteria bacterium RIFCSPLOWO2_02_FULL_43_11]